MRWSTGYSMSRRTRSSRLFTIWGTPSDIGRPIGEDPRLHLTGGKSAGTEPCSPGSSGGSAARESTGRQRERSAARGTEIRIPDPGFATWIAGRLSAAVIVDQSLFEDERVELLQLLAAVAAPNTTILDRVLARLAMAADPVDPAMLDALEVAAGPAKIQSTPGFEGNLPA